MSRAPLEQEHKRGSMKKSWRSSSAPGLPGELGRAVRELRSGTATAGDHHSHHDWHHLPAAVRHIRFGVRRHARPPQCSLGQRIGRPLSGGSTSPTEPPTSRTGGLADRSDRRGRSHSVQTDPHADPRRDAQHNSGCARFVVSVPTFSAPGYRRRRRASLHAPPDTRGAAGHYPVAERLRNPEGWPSIAAQDIGW